MAVMQGFCSIKPIKGGSGWITSPEYPGWYGGGLNKVTTFDKKKTQTIKFNVVYLRVCAEEPIECKAEIPICYVLSDDNACSSAESEITSQSCKEIKSSAEYATLRFESDNPDAAALQYTSLMGFNLSYEYTDCLTADAEPGERSTTTSPSDPSSSKPGHQTSKGTTTAPTSTDNRELGKQEIEKNIVIIIASTALIAIILAAAIIWKMKHRATRDAGGGSMYEMAGEADAAKPNDHVYSVIAPPRVDAHVVEAAEGSSEEPAVMVSNILYEQAPLRQL